MFTLLALSAVCLVVLVVISILLAVVLTIIGLPMAILFGLLPWLLRVAGVVLLFKAMFEKPTRWENFLPAVAAFGLSWVLGWF